MNSRIRYIAALAVSACATYVPGDIVLPTLPPGTQYRLAFVTSATRDATSANIADYNTFVSTFANNQPILAAFGTTWSVIGSTPTVSARANTMTDPTPAGDTGA